MKWLFSADLQGAGVAVLVTVTFYVNSGALQFAFQRDALAKEAAEDRRRREEAERAEQEERWREDVQKELQAGGSRPGQFGNIRGPNSQYAAQGPMTQAPRAPYSYLPDEQRRMIEGSQARPWNRPGSPTPSGRRLP